MNLESKILDLVKQANPDNPLDYVRNVVKCYAREKLDNYILECQDCPIHNTTKTLTYGNVNASVLVVTDAVLPSQNIDGTKKTFPLFNTKSYDILSKTLKFYGLNAEEMFFINAVNCCPYDKINDQIFYRIPNQYEKSKCRTFIDYAFKLIDPIFVILLGNVALNCFVKSNIFRCHGQDINVHGVNAIAAYSPDYLIWCEENNPGKYEFEKNIFINDFEKIKNKLSVYQGTNLFL